jgi:hypothetical protein
MLKMAVNEGQIGSCFCSEYNSESAVYKLLCLRIKVSINKLNILAVINFPNVLRENKVWKKHSLPQQL